MQNLTAQHLARLYEEFGDTEMTFNAQVIFESGLITSDVRLTIGANHLPCVLYACSMKGARVIAEIGHNASDILARNSAVATLHLGFKQRDEKAPVSFFVGCRVESLSEYNAQKQQVRFVALEFTQKPSDALFEILGSLLEIKSNSLRRRDQRIVLTPENMKKIGLESRESCVAIDGSSRRCLVRDLSFGGAKVLLSMLGLPQGPRKVLLKLQKCEVKDDTVLDGSIVRVEDVEGHEDLVALSIKYSTDPPISYKQKINSVFTSP
ncbi:MAG: PilZ domain-containing protein [Spirochaetia bacterium]